MLVIVWFTTIIIVFVSEISKSQNIEPVAILRYLHGGHHTVGGSVELECRTTFYENYTSLVWKTPLTCNDYEYSILSENATSNYLTTSTLNISKVEANYTGFYTCEIIHKQLNYPVATKKMWIKVHTPNDEILDIGYYQPFTTKSYAEIKIPIKAHPNISVTWKNPRGEIIKNSSKITTSVILTDHNEEYNYQATLFFNYITLEELGNYEITVGNGVKEQSRKINVEVEKINVDVRFINIDEGGMTATYECSALGYTKPNITWVFVPCTILQCLNYKMEGRQFLGEETVLKELYYDDRGLQVISNVSVNLTRIGILKCVTQKSEAAVPILYIDNGFENFIKSEWDLDNVKNEILDVGYRQPVTVLCLRSLDKYISDVFWFHNDKLIDTKEPRYFNKFNDTILNIAVDMLIFNYILEDQLGNFTCQAIKRTGEVESKRVKVVSKNMCSLYPEVALQASNGGQTIVGQNITLICNVTYYRHVRIGWRFDKIKNKGGRMEQAHLLGQELLPDDEKIDITNITNVNNLNFYVTTSYLTISQANSSNTGYYGCIITENVTLNQFLWVDFYDPILEKSKFPRFDVENKKTEEVEHSIEVNVTGVAIPPKIDIYKKSAANTTLKCSSTSNPTLSIKWYFKNCTTLKCCLERDFTESEPQNKYFPLQEMWNENDGFKNISYISGDFSKRGVLVCQSRSSLGNNVTYEPILGSDKEFEMSTENEDDIKHIDRTIEFIGKNKFKFICGASRSKYMNKFGWSRVPNKFSSNQTYDCVDIETEKQLDFLFSSFSILTISVRKPSKNSCSCSVLTRDDGLLKSQTFQVESRNLDSAYVSILNTNMCNNSVQVDLKSKWTFRCKPEGFPKPNVKWFKNDEDIPYSKKFKWTDHGQVLEIDHVDPDDEGMYKCEAFNQYKKDVKYSTVTIVIRNEWLYVQTIFVLLALIFVAVLVYMKSRKTRKVEKKLKLFGLYHVTDMSKDKIDSKLRIEDQAVLLPFARKWEIPFKNIRIGKRLGSGTFGVTFQANIVNFFPGDPNKTVAIKTVNIASGFECVKALVSDLKILSHVGSHVNIVNFLGACTRHIVKDELYVVLEFCCFGNLLEYIKRNAPKFVDQKDYDSDVFNWTSASDGDDVEKKNSVSSRNLLIWSFQIARGMEYLGSRRIVHGDLAARNVLLTNNNVVKVCDLGLSKNVFNYKEYVKKSQGPFPVKWMALETIENGIFSTRSDVWSFGVVLWELFSLGETPYPALVVDENFCKKLAGGYKMESPKTATTEIYNIMLACWQLDPALRPSFTKLADQIGSLLNDSIKNYYIGMNDSYILMNEKRKASVDYLTIISSNVVTRNYENWNISQVSNITDKAKPE